MGCAGGCCDGGAILVKMKVAVATLRVMIDKTNDNVDLDMVT
jgi:hypothetical protein